MDVPFKTIFGNVGVSWSPYMQTRAALSWHNFNNSIISGCEWGCVFEFTDGLGITLRGCVFEYIYGNGSGFEQACLYGWDLFVTLNPHRKM